ncbi:hypothetical protein COT98_01840 [Candidatus Falkowbacteria bacterium CG10_big_fil_rev_8_21_14_0_10_39_9]|uniref:Uncharacterized protein n=1 Tax=Candidatus Falkowbacteria bacterium CG10_big_fil_rev_8_21_14_0_10_39_9 TaxID=1974566 RepID=A0A2M6WQ02_9BACT|nr:MAG: hypothetical protein COT98_01840 [Candidatus Falkowbacteria bacterium CG10_big_fil_rev_8_21_14_0_10_39_9]
MTRRQYIIIAGTTVIIVCLAIWLGIKLLSNKPAVTNTNTGQKISAPKTSYTDRLLILQELFAQQLGITKDQVMVNIAREDYSHIKGIVTIKDKYEGIFLATRIDGNWKIVWEGKGKYPCSTIQSYNFPGEMVSDCLK